MFKQHKGGQSGSITPAVSGDQKVGKGYITPSVSGVPNAPKGGDEITSGKQRRTKLVNMFLAYLKPLKNLSIWSRNIVRENKNSSTGGDYQRT